MEAAQPPSSPGPGTGASESSSSGEKGGKKKWGLGGMVRRVTGSGPSAGAAGDKEVRKEGSDSSAEEASGLQVDFYLVIVSLIVPWRGTKLTDSFSNLSLVSYRPLR